MNSKLLLVFILMIQGALSAQPYLTGVASRWSDDFSEWDFYTEDDEEYASGELRMRWQQRGDWNVWDYQIGEERGYISTVFTDDASRWELVGPNNEVITMRQLWNNDARAWKVTANTVSLTFKSRWGNRRDEWIVRERTRGDFHVYTRWEGDPRDWIIVDELDEELGTSMKVAMVFLALFNTIR